MKRKCKNNQGASAVEFALVLPMLVLLLFGIIEFSLALYDKAMITNASREGARAGVVYKVPRLSVADIQGVVTNYCQNYLITFGAANSVITNVTGAGGSSGSNLTVSVNYTYGFLVIPKFVTSITGPITLSATSVMVME